MNKWFLKRRVCRKLQASLCSLVVVSLVLAPVTAEAAAASQTAAQNTSGNTNNMASMLSTGVAVLSMATGALTMAKGTQQMACCMKGCDGAGKEGVEKKASQDAAAKLKGDSVIESAIKDSGVKTSTPAATGTTGANRWEPEFERRFPDSASLDDAFGAKARLGLMIRLFRAPSANASGCIDAALALATGGLMLLQGMMAMKSAQQAATNADASYNNAGSLGAIDPGLSGLGPEASGTVAKPGEVRTDGSSLAGANGSKSAIRIDPALLRNGKAEGVMARFEKQFGIDRDQFAADVASGKDPRELLAAAPQNSMSVTDINKATAAARGLSDAEKESALGASELADIQKEIAAKAGFGLEDTSYQAAGKAAPSRKIASSDSLDDLGLDAAAAPESAVISPQLKAALAKREEDFSQKSHFDTTLFEVVHRKYVEKAKMISGSGIKAGVGHVGE